MMNLSVVWLIIVEVSLGASQLVNLTQNSDDGMIICPGEEVTYTCTADTQLGRLQWIAEPYVMDTNIRRVVDNIMSEVGSTINIGDIVIQYVSNDPFVSTLTLNGATATTSTNVTCSTVGLTPGSVFNQPYITNDGIVKEVSILNAVHNGSNSYGFNFVVNFTSSPSLDIERYIVSCSDNKCPEVEVNSTENSDVFNVSGTCQDIVSCEVFVRAINRCGNQSTNVAQRVLGPVMPVSDFILMEADDDDNPSTTQICGSFTPSATPNISQYQVNCSDNACKNFSVNGTVNSFTIDVSSSCTGKTYTISICAVDRDKRMSRTLTQSVQVQEIKTYCALVVVFPFTAAFLLASLVVILVLAIYIVRDKKMKTTEEEELQKTEHSREEKL